MSQSKMDVVHDLSKLLQGCHMGSSTFQEYLGQTQSSALKSILIESLDIFRKHEIALTKHIQALQSNTEEDITISELIAEFFEKIKAQMADNDRKLLDYSIKGIDMGLTACQDFKKKHHDMQHDLVESIDQLESDYKQIYQKFINLKLDSD